MTHPATAPASIPLPTWDNGQQRLSAAIALFRSEASASGYVVEEVRLRLPVPDVDVMPRVVIAQQSAANNTPPVYPPQKYHRAMNHPDVQAERHKVPPKKMPRSPPFGLRSQPVPMAVDQKIVGPLPKSKGMGFKRTVSGSVIVRQQPPGQPSGLGKISKEVHPPLIPEGHEVKHPPKLVKEVDDEPPKMREEDDNGDEDLDEDENDSPRKEGKLWNKFMSTDKRVALFKAAESMQSLRNGSFASRKVSQLHDGEEESRMQSDDSDSENMSPLKSRLLRRKSEDEVEDEEGQPNPSQGGGQNRPNAEKTLKYNGHNIPESHVQLLLSSVATIGSREPSSSDKESGSTEESTDKTRREEKAAVSSTVPSSSPDNSQEAIMPRPERPPTRPSKSSSRSRRDSAERPRTSSALRPFKCHKCPSSFDRDGHLKVHILAVHEKKRPFVCQVCDASFGHSSSLLRHVRTVHQASPAVGSGRVGPSGKNASANAGTERAARRSVEEGWEEVQDGAEKIFRCSTCSLAFSRVALLNRHVANKHPVQPAVNATKEADSELKESP